MMDPAAEAWRARASALRRLAEHLDRTPLDQLRRAAGPDTWAGPLADELSAAIGGFERDVHGAAEDLRWEAWLLDQRADQIDIRLGGAGQ